MDRITLTRRVYENSSVDELITPCLTFSYVRRGSKLLFVNGTEYVLQAGDLLVIPANTAVFSYFNTQESCFESVTVTVLPACEQVPPRTDQVVRLIRNKTVSKLVEKLVESDCSTVQRHAGIQNLLKLYVQSLTRSSAPKHPNEPVERSDQLLSKVSASLYDPVRLPQIANDCAMSLSTFKRHFQRCFGLSPKDWIIRRRLESAYFEILVLKKSISEACYQNGFENIAHFSYSFKRQFGFAASTLLKRRANLD